MTELSKIAEKYLTDKGCTYYNSHNYTEIYDSYFNQFKCENRKINILEIGVQYGYDLLMINEYFEGNCEIYGFDIDLSNIKIELPDNIHLFQIDATNIDILNNFYYSQLNASVFNIPKFDIIIDDGSHYSNDIIKSLSFFWNKLNNNGIYIIEDLHANYFNDNNNYESSALYFLNFYNIDNNLNNLDTRAIISHIKSCNIYHLMKYNDSNLFVNISPNNIISTISTCAILKFNI